MREPALALTLKKCLDEMEHGGQPEAVAHAYPALSSTMLPLMRIADRLRHTRESYAMPTEFLRSLRMRLMTMTLDRPSHKAL